MQLPLPEGDVDRNALTRGFGEAFLDNLMGTPDLVLTGGTRMLTGQPLVEPPFAPPNPEGTPEPPVKLPRVGERVLPLPRGEQVMAGAEAAGRTLAGGESLPAEYRGARIRQEAAQAQEPGIFGAGQVLGDVATLVTGRMPFARRLARRPQGLPRINDNQVADTLEAIGRSNPDLAPRVVELIGSARLASPGASRLWGRVSEKLGRAFRKSAEKGLEGAVLGALQENDPLTTGALAAGGQLATSIAGGAFGIPMSAKGLLFKAGSLVAL